MLLGILKIIYCMTALGSIIIVAYTYIRSCVPLTQKYRKVNKTKQNTVTKIDLYCFYITLSCDIAVIYHRGQSYRNTPFLCHGNVIFTRASSYLNMSTIIQKQRCTNFKFRYLLRDFRFGLC